MNSPPRLILPASNIPDRAPPPPLEDGSPAARRTRSIPIPSRTHPAASSRSLRCSRHPGVPSVPTTVRVASPLCTTLTSQPSTCPLLTHGTSGHGWTARRAAPTRSRRRARLGRSSWSRSSAISEGRFPLKSADSTSTRPPHTSWSRGPRQRASTATLRPRGSRRIRIFVKGARTKTARIKVSYQSRKQS